MPIPGSILSNQIMPEMQGNLVGFYPSRATFMPLVITDDTNGQEIHTFTPSVDPTLSNLACRKVPLRTDRVQEQEVNSSTIQRTQADFRLGFNGYVNVPEQTLNNWQVNVDGIVYQIQSVEADGSKLTTRLMIGILTPYNA